MEPLPWALGIFAPKNQQSPSPHTSLPSQLGKAESCMPLPQLLPPQLGKFCHGGRGSEFASQLWK